MVIEKFENGYTTEGYLGAIKWVGNNSHKRLYGKDLAAAIRQDLKDAHLGRVSVACSRSGSIRITMTIYEQNFSDYEHWKLMVKAGGQLVNYNSVWNGERWISADEYYALSGDELEAVYRANYELQKKQTDINEYYIDRYYILTPETRSRLFKIKQIVDSYNYDDSNPMVDYFNTRFYASYSLKLKN